MASPSVRTACSASSTSVLVIARIASMSSTSSRPMISRFEEAMGLPAFHECAGGKPGDDEVGEKAARVVRVGKVDGGLGHEHIRAQDTREPVARADRLGIGEPAVERGCQCVTDFGEHAVTGCEREVREHRRGLMLEEEAQCRVPSKL